MIASITTSRDVTEKKGARRSSEVKEKFVAEEPYNGECYK
jgi:hypothetical protein